MIDQDKLTNDLQEVLKKHGMTKEGSFFYQYSPSYGKFYYGLTAPCEHCFALKIIDNLMEFSMQTTCTTKMTKN